jgi:predicted phosphoribosyltransferase
MSSWYPPFANRHQAGSELASRLEQYRGRYDVVVLALPRGGVPVAFEIAEALDAPLDIFIVRKLGMPGHPEFAMGALASGGVPVLSDDVVRWYGIPQSAIDTVVRQERAELERREREYRRGAPLVDLRGRTVILVDDGLATGATMKAAVLAVRTHEPARVVVAVPVGAPASCAELAAMADEVVCVSKPENFSAVGQWYQEFAQTTDEEVLSLLHASRVRSDARERLRLETDGG